MASYWDRFSRERLSRRAMLRNGALASGGMLAIAITVYAFNILGDAIRDVLDSRLRGL